MEGSWEGIAGCVVHVDVHGVCMLWVDAICNVVAHERMFLVGCCSWLRSILYSNRMLYWKKADVSTAILQSSSEHTQQCFVHAVYVLCMLCML